MNPKQIGAIESLALWNIILAGPGSGKSTVIIERAKKLVADGMLPSTMAFVTFTSAGAKILLKKLKEAGIEPGFCGTLHSMMFGYLKRDDPRWTIVGEDDAEEFLMRQAKILGYKGSADALKQARQSENNVVKFKVKDEAACRVIRSYRMFMRRENLLDYDMVLLEGLRLIDSGRVQNKWPVLFVDEFQDSAPADLAIYLALKPKHLFVVGDFDQSIFRFRGARPENIMDCWNDDRFMRHVLDENYRCSEAVCEVANAVIRENCDRIDKDTVSATGETGCVSIPRPCKDESAERTLVANRVSGWINKGTPPKDIAVLCRTNRLVDEMRSHLKAYGIAINEAETERKPKDWKLLTLIVSMIASPTSWAVARLLTRERAKIQKGNPEEDEERLDEIKKKTTIQPLEWFDLPSLSVVLSMNANLSRYGVSKASHELLAARIRLFDPTTVEELLEAMRESPETVYKHGVNVSTVHGAKGTEFKCVAVPGTDLYSRDEEDTCLMFVALTRAERNLFVTCSLTRTFKLPSGRIETSEKVPGRFWEVIKEAAPVNKLEPAIA